MILFHTEKLVRTFTPTLYTEVRYINTISFKMQTIFFVSLTALLKQYGLQLA
jgi:hypothetical protein